MKAKAKEKRLEIFKRFATNLKECLEYYEVCAVTKVDDKIKRIDQNIYVCPLCKKFYYEDSVYQTNERQVLLTLEHNPPENIGGAASILTCSTCNNMNGSKVDKVVGTYLKTDDFIEGKDGAKIEGRYKIDNHSFRGELELNRNKHNILYLDKKSNPFGFSKLLNHSEGININKITFQYKLADWDVLMMSLLKIAHLTAFKYLGYSYLLNHSGHNIIQVLNGALKHPSDNCGVVGFDFNDEHLGLNVIKEPKELRSLLVVQKVKILGKEKNVGVAIPAPEDEGFKTLVNFNKYKNIEVQFNLIKQEFSGFPCPVDTYYDMFA